MSRHALIGFALAVVGAIATAAATTDAREAASRPHTRVVMQFHCATAGRTLRYTFWPKGHLGRGTPSAFPEGTYSGDAPDRTLPHLNVYSKGASWTDRKWLAFIGDIPAAGQMPAISGLASVGWHSETRPCAGPLPGDRVDEATDLKSSTRATALRCRFTSRYGYVGLSVNSQGKRRGAVVYQRNAGNQAKRPVLVKATLGTKRPKVTWNTAFCRRIALPR